MSFTKLAHLDGPQGLKRNGEVSEWSKEHAWKVCIREIVSRVQIPSSPPHSTKSPRAEKHGGLFVFGPLGLLCGPKILKADRSGKPSGTWRPLEQVVIPQIVPHIAPIAFVEHVIHGQAQHRVIPANARTIPAPYIEHGVPANLHIARLARILAGAVARPAQQGQPRYRQRVLRVQCCPEPGTLIA